MTLVGTRDQSELERSILGLFVCILRDSMTDEQLPRRESRERREIKLGDSGSVCDDCASNARIGKRLARDSAMENSACFTTARISHWLGSTTTSRLSKSFRRSQAGSASSCKERALQTSGSDELQLVHGESLCELACSPGRR